MPIHDNEQHRLLVMIEQMQRRGLSQREITAAVREATSDDAASPPQRSREARPARFRLARRALQRMSS